MFVSVHRVYKSNEEFDIYDESRPLKMNVFIWRLWKWGNWCDLEDSDINARTMKCEDFCFRSFIFSCLSHRKPRTIKGGRGKTKEKFPSDAQLKILHLPILRVKPLEISYQFSQFHQWQGRRSFGLWGICPDWGVRNSPVQIAYTVRNLIALRNLRVKFPIVVVLRASCPKYLIHLTVTSLKGIYVLSCRAAP